MDPNSENNGATWFSKLLSENDQQSSPGGPGECNYIVGEQLTLGYPNVTSVVCQDGIKSSPVNSPAPQQQIQFHRLPDSPLSPSNIGEQSPEPKILLTNLQPAIIQTQQSLHKRHSQVSFIEQQNNEPPRKISRREGCAENNGSNGWPAHVQEFAEHLDVFESLAAHDIDTVVTAVASYDLNEALLAHTHAVFKQEAPSPETQHNSSNLNQVSQQNHNAPPATYLEADSNTSIQNPQNVQQQLYPPSNDYPSTNSGSQVTLSAHNGENSEESRFQYILAAPTSIATKVNEESLTYLNQGQPYEIKLKKIGDSPNLNGKAVRTSVRITFHERRLHYSEREQMLAWQESHPGERLLDIDVPLSYGLCDMQQSATIQNRFDFLWDPAKEAGCYIKINCISTEFTPKKHGGEKGVPFRIQVETKSLNGKLLHAAFCQIKVFKLKGADRKHKQDRDKIQRRPLNEQEKYKPSYEYTVLADLPLESALVVNSTDPCGSPCTSSDSISLPSRSTNNDSPPPVTGSLGLSANPALVSNNDSSSEIIKSDVRASPVTTSAIRGVPNEHNSDIRVIPYNPILRELPSNASAAETTVWLRARRFHAFESTFANYSASDILSLSRDDLIQLCGLNDGVRLYNALHAKPLKPKLRLYFTTDFQYWRAIYLETLSCSMLITKLLRDFELPRDKLHSVLTIGPHGVHVLITNDIVANMKDDSMFLLQIIREGDRYKLLFKPYTGC